MEARTSTSSQTAWLVLHGLGYSVFPLRSRSKRPTGPWKQYQTTPASRELILGWSLDPGLNIGIATGAISSIVVLDLDSADALSEAERRGLPDTVQVRTPRGHHLYFSHPGRDVCNRAGVFPGADIRGDGGYVVAPGSTFVPDHKEAAEGKVAGTYEWIRSPDAVSLADMPGWLLQLVTPAADARPTQGRQTLIHREGAWGKAALADELEQLARATEGARNETLNRAAFKLFQIVAKGNLEEILVRDELTAAALKLGLDLPEIEATLASAASAGGESPRGPREGSFGQSSPFPYAEADATEEGIARAFIDKYEQTHRFDHDVGCWYIWEGSRWLQNRTRLAFDQVRELCQRSGNIRLKRASAIGGAERIAQSDQRIAVTSACWDRDPWLLATPGGTVDLHTGRLMPARPQDMLTKCAAVAPSPSSDCPRWQAFLNEATGGDLQLQRYLQKVAGYVLTGVTSEQALFFVYGPGGNGKSVFLGTLSSILGDYAAVAPMDTFTASKSDRHLTEIAMLRGARLVSVGETEEGRAWAEARIKQLTGGDRVTARFMRQDNFTYIPAFKLLIVGNHKPVLKNVDDAARRRFNIIPFTCVPRVPDKELDQKLRSEWPQIMRWAIEGCLLWQTEGLRQPDVVADATRGYFEDQDILGQWIEQECETGQGKWDPIAKLFASWQEFAARGGEEPGSKRSFGDALTKRGFRPDRLSGGSRTRIYRGLALAFDPARSGINHD